MWNNKKNIKAITQTHTQNGSLGQNSKAIDDDT
jgi:hypothetical protein